MLKQNCLTSLLADLSEALDRRYHFGYRFIMNGYSDELLYEKEFLISGGFSFKGLKKHRYINQYVENDPDAVLDYSRKYSPGQRHEKSLNELPLIIIVAYDAIDQIIDLLYKKV